LQLEEFRLVVASNIIKLRSDAGMTQAELGAALNYSDKSISKWERGEGLPDAFVLKSIAELFDVPVDYIVSSHDAWESPEEKKRREMPVYSASMIIATGDFAVMTAAVTAFVILWLVGLFEWRILLIGVSVMLLVHLVLDCVFLKARHLQYLCSAFIVSLLAVAYFFMWQTRPWPLFLIAAPAIGIVFLACNIKKVPERLKKHKKKTE